MKAVRMDDQGPVRVGSTGRATVRMYGLAVTDPVTITILEPPHRFGLTHEGLFAGGGTFDLRRGADELRWDGAPQDAWEGFCDEWGLDRLRRRPHRWLDQS